MNNTRIRYNPGETPGSEVSKPILVGNQVLEVIINGWSGGFTGDVTDYKMQIVDKSTKQVLVVNDYPTSPAAKLAAKAFLKGMGAHFHKEVRNRKTKETASEFAPLENVYTAVDFDENGDLIMEKSNGKLD